MRGLQWPGLTAFLVQFALGLCDPIPLFSDGEAKNPVAYLYNGVRLPPLPEYDKEKYPFACIAKTWIGGYVLGVSQSATLVRDHESGVRCDWVGPHLYCFLSTSGKWGEFTYTEDTTGASIYPDFSMWANHDIEYNGEVIVTASDPVPVYE